MLNKIINTLKGNKNPAILAVQAKAPVDNIPVLTDPYLPTECINDRKYLNYRHDALGTLFVIDHESESIPSVDSLVGTAVFQEALRSIVDGDPNDLGKRILIRRAGPNTRVKRYIFTHAYAIFLPEQQMLQYLEDNCHRHYPNWINRHKSRILELVEQFD